MPSLPSQFNFFLMNLNTSKLQYYKIYTKYSQYKIWCNNCIFIKYNKKMIDLHLSIKSSSLLLSLDSIIDFYGYLSKV